MIIFLGGGVAAAFAALIGPVVLRLRGAYFAVLTFGLGEVVRHTVTYVEKSQSGTVGRVLIDTPPAGTVYVTVALLAALAAIAYRLVARSDLGFALRGIGDDEERAATLGVHTGRAKLAAFCLTAWFAGAVGAAAAVRWTYIDPTSVFNPFILFQTVLIAMVGGPSKLRGPILGALIFTLLAELLRLRLPYLYMIVLGILLILSVLVLPEGLAGVRWIDRLLAPRSRPRAGAEASHV